MSYLGYKSLALPGNHASGDQPENTKVHDNGDGTLCNLIRLYNGTGSTLALGSFVIVGYGATVATNPKVGSTYATSGAGMTNKPAASFEEVASAEWGWFIEHGYGDILAHGGTDIAVGDGVGVELGGGTGTAFSLKKVTTTKNRVGVAYEAYTDTPEVPIRIYMIGRDLQFD